MPWLREPLVHFLAIGAALFVIAAWSGGGASSHRIVITPGQVDAMAAGFARVWQRPPTEQELKGLLDDHVREELAVREAMVAGLDRDDTVIRRRLRQKFEFVAEDTIAAMPVTDADLQAWLTAHADQYQIEPQVSLRHVYLSPDRRGAAIDADARALFDRLEKTPAPANLDRLGDPLQLPSELERSSRGDIARLFGDEFAVSVTAEATPGRWTGPWRSGYGLHLVFVTERIDARAPSLADVRPAVERDFLNDRRVRELDQLYGRLLQQYRVVIDNGAPTSATGSK